jgi:hypothetical protein
MKPLRLIVMFMAVCCAQNPPFPPPGPPPDLDSKLPNGKSRRDEIAKADYKKNVEDAAELLKLAETLKADLDKDNAYIVSVKTIKTTEDIEKLARNIRGRLKRY